MKGKLCETLRRRLQFIDIITNVEREKLICPSYRDPDIPIFKKGSLRFFTRRKGETNGYYVPKH